MQIGQYGLNRLAPAGFILSKGDTRKVELDWRKGSIGKNDMRFDVELQAPFPNFLFHLLVECDILGITREAGGVKRIMDRDGHSLNTQLLQTVQIELNRQQNLRLKQVGSSITVGSQQLGAKGHRIFGAGL